MLAVREGVGVEAVNGQVAGVVGGGAAAAEELILEVDSAVCGEIEALDELEPGRVESALYAAAAGGRLAGNWTRYAEDGSSI